MAKIKSLSTKHKLGYCGGILSESLVYNMYYTFYLFFLTDIAGLNSIAAGTVMFVSIIWDAVTDPIIGAYADRTGADKRKFMAKAIIPMCITFVACFTRVGFLGDTGKLIYYIAVTMLFWLAYTVYTIPYYAVVAEITSDYDERTDIRGTSALINAGGIFVGNALPALLPAAITGVVASAALGWTLTAIILSAISIVFAIIAVLSIKNSIKKSPEELAQPEKLKSVKEILLSFVEVGKLKPFKWFMLFTFFFLMTFSMVQANFVYLIKECIHRDYDEVMVYVIVLLVATIAVFTPIVTKISEIKDRKFTSILFLSITMIGLFVAKIIGVTTLPMVFFIAFFLALGAADFWAVFYPLAYDLIEVDEFVNGERREGIITSVPQFFQKFGSAVGVWSVGLMLKLSGYDTGNVSAGIIENSSTIIPAAFLAISIFGLVMFPVTKERFHKLQEVLAKKKLGEDYDTTGLEKIL